MLDLLHLIELRELFQKSSLENLLVVEEALRKAIKEKVDEIKKEELRNYQFHRCCGRDGELNGWCSDCPAFVDGYDEWLKEENKKYRS